MAWSIIVPHGATLRFLPTGAVVISHPKFATVRVRPRQRDTQFILHPIMTRGQLLELR